MIWLGIDTSHTPLAVAVVEDDRVLASYQSSLKITHSIGAMPAIEELLKKADIKPSEIDAIAVAIGPGSYTGVRIGVTIGKTLAWTLKKPIFSVSSLQVLASNASYFPGIVCAIMDARRGNVFAGIYTNGEAVKEAHMPLVELLKTVDEMGQPVLFVGMDVGIHWEQIKEVLGDRVERANAAFSLPNAAVLVELAKKLQPTEVHTTVPEYLRITEAEANWMKEQKKNDNK
ncbi:tRNA (adenosine(37)-N6)-threonylcarbamoyltransferase complex dimerization subunit type 1 TsaB [Psychrobacillus sp. NEAU-3TGS]|uniref:tRNA (adenosine(37)-N6)-threonylcarbamoyltransferase complex dimerization subunit type 1 TsaB n=1 Tax=Psychrobacillus sp. NEAU-3TGS TaxID=2995412 RepID=UPI00249748F3|nr:tRNA (adenosine(37)-N6)-threonylcarbamoyltransferase complex dimerization subunit type 1 TsaB [Psychrobacillus sp. NEAU-3TGS]MDI2586884.1 tRNA (adenosine(37)-N6)-threonylcarbamoyltransferase complex dimerization subunit type 1 TsaB [Psychrobacillus sp. NEAU-3TGS]